MLVSSRHGASRLAATAMVSCRTAASHAPYSHHALRPLSLISRHASSSSSSSSSSTISHSATSKKLSSTNLATPSLSTALNPPTSTLPPPLDLPTRTPSQSAPGYYLSLGRAYLAFYKAGLKQTWANHTAARRVRSRLTLAPTAAARAGVLTRRDWHLLRRAASDTSRIPAFALLFLVCGEFTPLVVLAAGDGVVPRTCWIPRQVEGSRRKREERRAASFREGTVEGEGEGGGKEGPGEWAVLTGRQRAHVARSLGLYARVWDRVGGLPGAFVRARAQRWRENVQVDDELLEKGGGAASLTHEEVKRACEERGLDVLGVAEKKLKARLDSWIKNRNAVGYWGLVLRRPNAWPDHKG